MQERKVVKNIPISNNFVKTIILSSEGLVLVNEQKTVEYQIYIYIYIDYSDTVITEFKSFKIPCN